MSQNFGNMSDIYIPKLIELDSYWKKAVEDAVYDTLKGEKRVYYALRNRKKIKQKLEKLGLRPIHSRRHELQSKSKRWKENFFKYRSPSTTEWEPIKKKPLPSVGTIENQGPHSSALEDRGSCCAGSRSRSSGRSQEKRGSSQEKRPPSQNPDSPLLGDGSHEKIKRSQNSFNYEPMGSRSSLMLSRSEEEFGARENSKHRKNVSADKQKEIEWLHVREDGTFKDSDTEGSNNEACKEVEKKEYERHSTVKDMNYFMKNKIDLSSIPNNGMAEPGPSNDKNQKIRVQFDLQEELFWEDEVKKAIKENAGLERKLCLALAKRKIVSKGTRRGNNKIQIQKSLTDTRYKRKKQKNLLSPFVKFYLEVYRELCRKRPVEEIAPEAVARWRDMSINQKDNESKPKSFEN